MSGTGSWDDVWARCTRTADTVAHGYAGETVHTCAYTCGTTTTYKNRSVPFCSAPYSRAPFANRTQSSNIPRLNLRRLNLLRAFLAPFDMQHTSLSPHSSSSTRMLSRRCAISRAIMLANAACIDCGMPSFAFCKNISLSLSSFSFRRIVASLSLALSSS